MWRPEEKEVNSKLNQLATYLVTVVETLHQRQTYYGKHTQHGLFGWHTVQRITVVGMYLDGTQCKESKWGVWMMGNEIH
jgi:hypothetical protein